MNKKGFVGDIIFILIVLFLTVISTLVGYTIYNKYVEGTADMEIFNTSANNNITAMGQTTMKNFDYLFIFIVVGLIIMTIISTFSIRTHPIFFFISVLLLILAIIFSGTFANIYETFIGTEAFAEAGTQYTVMGYFMSHFPTMILLIGAILLIILFAKEKMQG